MVTPLAKETRPIAERVALHTDLVKFARLSHLACCVAHDPFS